MSHNEPRFWIMVYILKKSQNVCFFDVTSDVQSIITPHLVCFMTGSLNRVGEMETDVFQVKTSGPFKGLCWVKSLVLFSRPENMISHLRTKICTRRPPGFENKR